MYIKAVKKNWTTVNNAQEAVYIGGIVNGYCVKDSPSTICGHDLFENPFDFIFLEVEPEGIQDFYEFSFDPTFYFSSNMRIKRSIPMDDLKAMDYLFKQRCEDYEKAAH